MNKKGLFFVLIMTMMVVILGACTKMETEEFAKTPSEKPTLEVIDGSMLRKDNITSTSTSWVNKQTSEFDAKLGTETKSFSVDIPQDITWQEVPEIIKQNLDFILINKTKGEVTSSDTSKNDVTYTTMTQDYGFDFLGCNVSFKTLNTKATLKLNGKSADFLWSNIDSLVFNRFDKEGRPTEKVTKDEIAYIRNFGNLIFDVYRTEKATGKKLDTEVVSVPVKVLVPEVINPGEDILEGMFKKGDGRLYKVQNLENTYRAEQDITLFYSISGKKDSLLTCDYEIKAWMQKAQDPFDVLNIAIGNPRTTPTPADEQYNKGDFKYTKTIKTWDNAWDNLYSTKAYTQTEKAKYVRGSSVIDMPFSDAILVYNGFVAGEPIEAAKNGKTYLRYKDGVIYFDWTYNNDKNSLPYGQIFDVEKGAVTITSVIKKGEGSFVHVQGSEYLSTQIITIEYSNGKKEDQTLTKKLYKTTTASGEQILTLSSPALNYNKATKSDDTKPTPDGDFVVTDHTRVYTFEFNEKYSFTVTSKYQTATYKIGAFEIEMPSSESVMTFNKYSYDPTSSEITKDGKKYDRYQGTSAVKETYNKEDQVVNVPVKVDVEKKANEITNIVKIDGSERLFKTPNMANMYTSEVGIRITYSDGATKDSLLSVNLNVYAETPLERTLFLNNNLMTWLNDNFPTAIPTSRKEGNYVINYYRKEFVSSYSNNFNYSIFGNYDVATWNYKTFVINMPSANMNIAYASQSSFDNGVGSNGEVNYNQTQFTFTHAVSYNGDNWEVQVPLKVNVIKMMEDNTPNGEIDVDAMKKYSGVTKSWDYNNNKAIIVPVIYKEGIEIYVNGKLDGFYDWTQVPRPEKLVDSTTNLISAVYDRNTGKWIPSSIATNANGNWDYIGNISGREVVRQVDKSLAILDLEKTPYLKYGKDFKYTEDGAVIINYDNWTLKLSIK